MDIPSILPVSWKVPAVFRERLGAKVGRQRTMFSDGHLLLVLHKPPRPGEEERSGRFFWRSPQGEWASSDLGSGPSAMNKHLGEYGDLIEKYDRLEENASEAEDYFDVLRAISPLQRAARHLHQVLQEARQRCPEDRNIINYRDRAYELERAADLLYGGTQHSLDFAVAKRSEEQAHASQKMALSAHRLNLLVAFFFPVATLAAIFGSNLKHGLEDVPAPVPFLILTLIGLFLGLFLWLFVSYDADRQMMLQAKSWEKEARKRGTGEGQSRL
jgi:hypothetical protein